MNCEGHVGSLLHIINARFWFVTLPGVRCGKVIQKVHVYSSASNPGTLLPAQTVHGKLTRGQNRAPLN